MRKHIGNTISLKIIMWLLIIVLPFNLVGLFSVSFSVKHAQTQARDSIRNVANMEITQLDARIESTATFFYTLEEDRDDFRLFLNQGERTTELVVAETNLASFFDRCCENDLYADSIFWYSQKYDKFFITMGDLQCYSRNQIAEIKEDIKKRLSDENDIFYGNWDYIEIGESEWIVKTYVENGLIYGSMFSLDKMKAELLENSSFENLEVLFEERGSAPSEKSNKIAITAQSKKADFQIELALPKADSLKYISWLESIALILFIIFVFAIPFLFYKLRQIVINPLHDLEEAMNIVRTTDPGYRIPEKKVAREFIEINHAFNEMNDTVMQLKIENYERKLEKQKMDLKNLQLQIRPHFLMNMFNLLFSFAQIENYKSIQKLALYLSDYFRHIFQTNRDTQPFEKEFNLIRKYLEVSKLRYPDWYEVTFNVDEDVLEVEVPPFLIHNFVENIFKHVIDYNTKTHIRLEAYTTETEAIFMIVDDGSGMPPETVEKINEGNFQEEDPNNYHVGIENSYKRMKSIYGERGKLIVDSIQGKGTCFTIVI
ncbi:MAG: histidine kinase, partial [Treponema sp.]|nr:histidine kinase [Treponema sp.]